MSIRYRRLGENNEPIMGKGNQDYLTDTDAVGQAVLTRLRFWRGEWWENQLLGLPMWQSILGVVGARKDSIDRIIQDSIQNTPGIYDIELISSVFNSETRQYQFYCVVNTIYGQTIITNI